MFTVHELEQQIDFFEEILLDLGIKIKSGSRLEDACLQIKDWKTKHLKEEEPDPFTDIRDNDRYITGITYLASKIIKVHRLGRLRPFVDHLKLLTTAEPTQTISHGADEASDKFFETIVGLCCAELSENVVMDNPRKSAGNNPDVIATLGDQTWAFACKVLHSKNPQTFFDRLAEGVDQIERADVDYGVVVLNLKNRFEHDSVFPMELDADGRPIYRAYKNPAVWDTTLRDFCTDTVLEMQERIGPQDVRNLFKTPKTPPMCLTYLQTCSTILRNGQPMSTGIAVAVDVTLTGRKLALPIRQIQQLEACLVTQEWAPPSESRISLATADQLRQRGIYV